MSAIYWVTHGHLEALFVKQIFFLGQLSVWFECIDVSLSSFNPPCLMQVLEIRPTIKWDKGKALEFLLESLGELFCIGLFV